MHEFATPDPITATVQVAGAKVRVTASDRTDTVVVVEPIDETNRLDVKVADKAKVTFADGRLLVKTTTSGDKGGSVAITIDLPTGSDLVAYLAHSTVHADGPLGACELHVAKGQVQLDRLAALQANISTGEAVIGHIAGRADIDGGAFAMRIGEVTGRVGISSSGGQSWIGLASADVDFISDDGSVDIDRTDGNVAARTGGGAIRIGRMTHGQARVTTGSGVIEIGISDGSTASVDAHSERGAVHDFVASSGVVHPAAPKVMVHARTRHGDIIIQPVAATPHEASVTSTS